MTILMACSSFIVTLFVYIMQRCWVKTWFREKHSKTQLQKLHRMSTKPERITGFYLLRAPKRENKTDRWVLYIINVNLVSIPLFLSVACLYEWGIASQNIRNYVFAAIGCRDLTALLLQMICMKFS